LVECQWIPADNLGSDDLQRIRHRQDPDQPDEHLRALGRFGPAGVAEEYRAAADLDREHDAEDRRAGRRIACPLLVLWSAGGPLGSWYTEAGGPLGLWRRWADDVRGDAILAGHFFPEELPDQTAERLHRFLTPGK
jgi:pimeloyl-ACP methyl ester carboxylesterase